MRLRLTDESFGTTLFLVRQTVGIVDSSVSGKPHRFGPGKYGSILVSVYHSTTRWPRRLETNWPSTSLSPRLNIVKDIQKHWLGSVPWERVLTVNQELCQAQNTLPQSKLNSCEAARQLWERAVSKPMSLPEALEVCRHCHDLSPFVFNNGNTFATISKALVEDWIQCLPPVEGQILRTTVGHYVAGQIKKNELLQVLRHAETRWQDPKRSPAAKSASERANANPAPSLMHPHPTP